MSQFLKVTADRLRAVIRDIDEQLKQLEKAAAPMTANEKLLRWMAGEMGVKEVPGVGDNPRVVEYHKYATLKNDIGDKDSVPWCSAILCMGVEVSLGVQSTNSKAARSWLKWGKSSKADPVSGDIVVFWRVSPASWQGHVGVFLRRNADGSIVVLGGNQGDEVNVTVYSGERLLDFRRYDKAIEYTPEIKRHLSSLAQDIIAGRPLLIADNNT